VRWKGRAGVFRRDVGDREHAEIVIAERIYRVRTAELGWWREAPIARRAEGFTRGPRACNIGDMILYLADGQDPLSHTFQALIVLADDEAAARGVILHEARGFRVDDIQSIKDYPGLDARRAVIARITIPEPAQDRLTPGWGEE
jgi:hypothetical protein